MNTTSLVSDVFRTVALAALVTAGLAMLNGAPTAVALTSQAATASFADPSVPAAGEALAGMADDSAPAAPSF